MQRPSTNGLLSAIAFGGVTALTAWLGARATTPNRGLWYSLLRKPKWQPPKSAFGPVWTALYGLIAASGWRVYKTEPCPTRTRALGLWGAQLALNGAWSWLFFAKRKPTVALADLGLLLACIGAYANEARKLDRTAAWMMAPYGAWTMYAGTLNEEIVRRNPRALLTTKHI